MMRILLFILMFLTMTAAATTNNPAHSSQNPASGNFNPTSPYPNQQSGVQTSPGVVLQTAPETLKQIRDFFDHSTYKNLKHYPTLPLFSIPGGKSL